MTLDVPFWLNVVWCWSSRRGRACRRKRSVRLSLSACQPRARVSPALVRHSRTPTASSLPDSYLTQLAKQTLSVRLQPMTLIPPHPPLHRPRPRPPRHVLIHHKRHARPRQNPHRVRPQPFVETFQPVGLERPPDAVWDRGVGVGRGGRLRLRGGSAGSGEGRRREGLTCIRERMTW